MTDPFDGLLAEHGDSPKALDWSAEGQRERFRVLREVGIGQRASVLDVGCGLGHFFDNLRSTGRFYGMYIGVDRSEAMIKGALRRTVDGNPSATFIFGDPLIGERYADLPTVDYAVASGVVNVEDGQNEEHALKLLRVCWHASTKACAVNFLSTFAPNQRRDRHYFDPMKWLQNALTLTPRVTLRHDYRDNDFTLYLYRSQR